MKSTFWFDFSIDLIFYCKSKSLDEEVHSFYDWVGINFLIKCLFEESVKYPRELTVQPEALPSKWNP